MKLIGLLIVAVICVGCKQEPKAVTAPVQTQPTKEEWRAECEKLKLSHSHKNPISEMVCFDPIPTIEVYKGFGKPRRTQTIGSMKFWYWQCSDGFIQAEIVEHGDQSIFFSAINDY